MGKSSPPPAPDYVGAATATAASSEAVNTDQTYANRANQTSPWGNVTWTPTASVDPSSGKPVTTWQQTTTLDPTLQSSLTDQLGIQNQRSDLAANTLGQLSGDVSSPVDWNSFQAGGGNVAANTTTAPGQLPSAQDERAKAEQAAYASQTADLDPRFAEQQTDLQTQLANKGITEGSDAYSRATSDFGRTKNDAYSQAMTNAINAGGTEAQRNSSMDLASQGQAFQQNLTANSQNFGQDVQSSALASTNRQQAIAEALQQRGFSLNQINALVSGQQVAMPDMPNYSGAGKAAGTDLSGAVNAQGNAANAAYGVEQSQSNAYTGAAATGLSAYLAFLAAA